MLVHAGLALADPLSLGDGMPARGTPATQSDIDILPAFFAV